LSACSKVDGSGSLARAEARPHRRGTYRPGVGLRPLGPKGCAYLRLGFLEIDHVVPIEAHGGATEIANLWRLCSQHHRLKTYERWRVTGKNGDRDLVPP